MSASTARHETRALLRAHLAAAYGYGHLTRHCPVCHRLLRLAMEPGDGARDGGRKAWDPGAAPEPPRGPQGPRNRAGSPVAPESAALPLEAVPLEATSMESTSMESTPVEPVPLEGDGDERPLAP